MEPTISITPSELAKAIEHAVNYHSIDAKVGMADFNLAKLLVGEMWKHLRGETDVQVFERMSPEERAAL